MTDLSFAVKGGASEFEAAVIAVVLDHIESGEQAEIRRVAQKSGRLSAWMRVVDPHGGLLPRHQVIIPD